MPKRLITSIVLSSFFLSSIGPLPQARAAEGIVLPVPGTMVNLSPAYEPALIKGLTVHKDNPFMFDFVVDTGNSLLTTKDERLKTEADRLIKYFFACLTIPEKDLWVNLSPYEKDRMVPEALGQTALGRDLLAEDYILKQLTASLIYPEKDLGKEFWNRIYAKAQQLYGNVQIPVNTFNKVWILADKATVYEHGQTAFVVDGHLKVMLEEDYLSLEKHATGTDSNSAVRLILGQELVSVPNKQSQTPNALGSQIVRELVLPELEREVNTGRNFATLRQIFNSLILASWYKKNLKEALLNQVYADKSTVKGVNLNDPSVKEQIYQQYLQAYKKGVFNYIKEEPSAGGEPIPRKYFSGGFVSAAMTVNVARDPATARAVRVSSSAVKVTTAVGFNGATPKILPASAAMTGIKAQANVAMSAKYDEELDAVQKTLHSALISANTLLHLQDSSIDDRDREKLEDQVLLWVKEAQKTLSQAHWTKVEPAVTLRQNLQGIKEVSEIISVLKHEMIDDQIEAAREAIAVTTKPSPAMTAKAGGKPLLTLSATGQNVVWQRSPRDVYLDFEQQKNPAKFQGPSERFFEVNDVALVLHLMIQKKDALPPAYEYRREGFLPLVDLQDPEIQGINQDIMRGLIREFFITTAGVAYPSVQELSGPDRYIGKIGDLEDIREDGYGLAADRKNFWEWAQANLSLLQEALRSPPPVTTQPDDSKDQTPPKDQELAKKAVEEHVIDDRAAFQSQIEPLLNNILGKVRHAKGAPWKAEFRLPGVSTHGLSISIIIDESNHLLKIRIYEGATRESIFPALRQDMVRVTGEELLKTDPEWKKVVEIFGVNEKKLLPKRQDRQGQPPASVSVEKKSFLKTMGTDFRKGRKIVVEQETYMVVYDKFTGMQLRGQFEKLIGSDTTAAGLILFNPSRFGSHLVIQEKHKSQFRDWLKSVSARFFEERIAATQKELNAAMLAEARRAYIKMVREGRDDQGVRARLVGLLRQKGSGVQEALLEALQDARPTQSRFDFEARRLDVNYAMQSQEPEKAIDADKNKVAEPKDDQTVQFSKEDWKPQRILGLYTYDIGDSDAAQTVTPGGIDLNTANMGVTVTKDQDGGVKVNFDPAMLERIKQEGVQSVVPVIINITPVADIRPLLGLVFQSTTTS